VRRFAVAIVVPALLVGACGDAPQGDDGELTAQAYPREDEAPSDDAGDGGEDDGQQAAAPLDDDAADTADTGEVGADETAPRPAHAATYVSDHLPADALDHDVLLIDDVAVPQLLLAVMTAEEDAYVEVATWTDGAFEHLDRVDAGPAEALGTLRTRRGGDDKTVVLGLHRDGGLRIGVWHLVTDGLQVPDTCPLRETRSFRGQGPSTVTVACEEGHGPPGALVWHDGVFAPPEDPPPAERRERPERPERDAPAEESDEETRPERGHPPSEQARPGRPERPGASGDRGRGGGPPDHARGRSDARDDPPGTQGRGPRGR
jgi:hypothetical protein